MMIGDTPIDLKAIKIPIYNLATREDHIAPAKSVLLGSKLLRRPGADSCSPAPATSPAWSIRRTRRNISTGPAPRPRDADLEGWLAKAKEHPGSWWPDWLAWLKRQDPTEVPGARSRRRRAQADRGRAGKLREGARLTRQRGEGFGPALVFERHRDLSATASGLCTGPFPAARIAAKIARAAKTAAKPGRATCPRNCAGLCSQWR